MSYRKYVELVPSEIDTNDNTLIDGQVYVGIPSDVNATEIDPVNFLSLILRYANSHLT